jgi:small GTP-binding protein
MICVPFWSIICAMEAKVVFVGDTGVGKTSIIRKQQNDRNPVFGTVCAEFARFTIPVNGTPVSFHVVDTPGSVTYRTLVPFSTHGAVVAVVICSIDDPESITSLPNWIRFVGDNSAPHLIILVRNKLDLHLIGPLPPEDELVRDLGIGATFNTSTVTGESISELFGAIAQAVHDAARSFPDSVHLKPVKIRSVKCC